MNQLKTIMALAEEKDVKSHILGICQTLWLRDMFVSYAIYIDKKPHTLESIHFCFVFKL